MNRPSMLGVALLFEDDSGKRNEGRLNTAWGLATPLVQNGGLVATVPTLGKYRGRWKGSGGRSFAAARGAWHLRRSSPCGRTLIYVPDSSMTLGGVLRGLLYRALSGSGRLIIIASQRRNVSRRVSLPARLADVRVITFDSWYARDLTARGVIARSTVPGIDRSAFTPRSEAEKAPAAEALGVGERENCILHVGHLNRRRGLGVLADLAAHCNARVVVVAGSASEIDEQVARPLLDAGVILVRRDFADIRAIYCAADVYVFPTTDAGGAIGFPLSVLEALAVGVPVVSAPFNDLPEAFPEGSGVCYASSSDEFCQRVNEVLAASSPVAIDERCLRGWDEVLEEVVLG